MATLEVEVEGTTEEEVVVVEEEAEEEEEEEEEGGKEEEEEFPFPFFTTIPASLSCLGVHR